MVSPAKDFEWPSSHNSKIYSLRTISITSGVWGIGSRCLRKCAKKWPAALRYRSKVAGFMIKDFNGPNSCLRLFLASWALPSTIRRLPISVSSFLADSERRLGWTPYRHNLGPRRTRVCEGKSNALVLLIILCNDRELDLPLFKIWRLTRESTKCKNRVFLILCLKIRQRILVSTALNSNLFICSRRSWDWPYFQRHPQTVFQDHKCAGTLVRNLS